MAYFHCLIGGGSSGSGYELTVTCDADFAGTTITCTDGVTTLTQTCPSASPYEVVFEIPNGGDWTISGVVGGQTASTGVNIPTTAELIAFVHKTVTIYSAKEDTVTYTDIYGDTQTEVFASGESSKQITVDIEPSGSSITFTSGVTKDPSDLSNNYSKTVTIDSNTTEVYIMPDNTLYWWGYMSDDVEVASSASGWVHSGYTYSNPTFNVNSARFAPGNNQDCVLGTKNKTSTSKVSLIAKGVTVQSNNYGFFAANTTKDTSVASLMQINTNTQKLYEYSTAISDKFIYVSTANSRAFDLYAFWYE